MGLRQRGWLHKSINYVPCVSCNYEQKASFFRSDRDFFVWGLPFRFMYRIQYERRWKWNAGWEDERRGQGDRRSSQKKRKWRPLTRGSLQTSPSHKRWRGSPPYFQSHWSLSRYAAAYFSTYELRCRFPSVVLLSLASSSSLRKGKCSLI